jgi:hypothetical protein
MYGVKTNLFYITRNEWVEERKLFFKLDIKLVHIYDVIIAVPSLFSVFFSLLVQAGGEIQLSLLNLL